MRRAPWPDLQDGQYMGHEGVVCMRVVMTVAAATALTSPEVNWAYRFRICPNQLCRWQACLEAVSAFFHNPHLPSRTQSLGLSLTSMRISVLGILNSKCLVVLHCFHFLEGTNEDAFAITATAGVIVNPTFRPLPRVALNGLT